jgi:hypothetical protein
MFKNLIICGALVGLGVSMFGCASDELTGAGKANRPPQVWLAAAPPEGSVSRYSIQLNWGAFDPDGEIAYYEYAITNNEPGQFVVPSSIMADDSLWTRVNGNDSTFIFTADLLADSSTTDFETMGSVNFIRTHTFFIRAIDNMGAVSEEPAYRSFTARNLSPTIQITIPRALGLSPALVPPKTTFRWAAVDYVTSPLEVQDPDSVRWILRSTRDFDESWTATLDHIRTHPDDSLWSDWMYYKAPQDSGKFLTTTTLPNGPYIFAVQAKDEAGAITPVFDAVRNVRRLLVSPRKNGPQLVVTNRFLGSIVTSSPNIRLAILDLPVGVPLTFCWQASAESYGGLVSGYRYGWDIIDLNDDDQWEIDISPFREDRDRECSPSRTFFFGVHTFFVEVVDNNGFKARAGVKLNVIPFTMERDLLVIDDVDEGKDAGIIRTNGGNPSDAEHDEFWRYVLSGVAGFDPAQDVLQLRKSDELPLERISRYKSIIWNSVGAHNSTSPLALMESIIHFIPTDPRFGGVVGKVTPNIAALFMEAGGHLLICGNEPMTMAINKGIFNQSIVYPFILRYELQGDQDGEYEDSNIGVRGVGDESFAYQDYCLNVLDITKIPNLQAIRDVETGCRVDNIRTHDGKTQGLRTCIPIDLDFPELKLRDIVAGPGLFYAPDKTGLSNDLYNPPYFQAACEAFAEIDTMRWCFEPIYGHGCLDLKSRIYRAPVAFWTSTFADRVPDVPGGRAAKSAIFGFEPYFFEPDAVKQAVEVIIGEWGLPMTN